MKLNPFNKDFGNRLWGASVMLWFFIAINDKYPIWLRILSIVPFLYFISYGVTRFDSDYKKII